MSAFPRLLPIAIAFALAFLLGSPSRATAAPTAAPPAVGDVAPPLSADGWLQVPDDTEVSWEALRGKVVVLEFWGTWCPPCVAAIPHLNDLAEELEGEDVAFLSVTFEDEAKIRPFLKERAMRSWVGLDPDRSMPEAYGVTGWPRTFLVDDKGRIAAITHPMNLSARPIRDMLEGRPPSLFIRDRSEAGSVRPSSEDSGAAGPLFEVSIRPSPGDRGTFSSGASAMTILGQRLETTLIPVAWEVRPSRLVVDDALELPAEPFDVRVRIPREDPDEVRRLLRMALEGTFGFEARMTAREVDVFVMTRAATGGDGDGDDDGNGDGDGDGDGDDDGDGDGDSDDKDSNGDKGEARRTGNGLLPTTSKEGTGYTSEKGSGFQVVGASADTLASVFERRLGRIVVDESGLDGRYDARFGGGDTIEALRRAAESQLGLCFVPARRRVELLVLTPRGKADR